MAISATPALLPETPLLAPGQTLPPASTTLPVITDPSAQLPTRIVIPAINLNAPIEPVGWSQVNGVNTWDIPDHFAAGWLKTSAPVGRPGNTVLDGHHNMAGEVFRHLVDLKAGDLIEVYSDDRMAVYEVTALHILPDRDQPLEVRRQNATWIQPTLDERLTLVTCWPYTNNTHRLIVVAAADRPEVAARRLPLAFCITNKKRLRSPHKRGAIFLRSYTSNSCLGSSTTPRHGRPA